MQQKYSIELLKREFWLFPFNYRSLFCKILTTTNPPATRVSTGLFLHALKLYVVLCMCIPTSTDHEDLKLHECSNDSNAAVHINRLLKCPLLHTVHRLRWQAGDNQFQALDNFKTTSETDMRQEGSGKEFSEHKSRIFI